jgi:tetratricopeptide (TPR) repeat protein
MFTMAMTALLLYTLPCAATDAWQLVERGNQAYMNGEYPHAAELYEEVLFMGFTAPELYYNLGNAYFRMNQVAKAILNYERGLRLRPSDEALRHNLRLAQQRLTDRIEPVPVLFYEKWKQNLLGRQTADGWARTSIAFAMAFLLGMLLYFFSRTRIVRKWSFFLALGLLFCSTLSLLAASDQYNVQTNRKEGIVFVPRTTAKSAPRPDSPDLFVVHEGSKVEMTGMIGDWVEIRLANGNMGWIKKEGLEII